jgi:hypothetical protein
MQTANILGLQTRLTGVTNDYAAQAYRHIARRIDGQRAQLIKIR